MRNLRIVSEPKEDADSIVREIRSNCPDGRVVFVSGNFNIIHPGHFRLLNFAAECGDMLVLGINADGPRGVLLPATLRLEGVRSIGIVDYAFTLSEPAENFIARLKPEVVVKGKEYESQFNPELAVIESYGGKLLFSSGEVMFSSLDLLRRELHESSFPTFNAAEEYLKRRQFAPRDLLSLIKSFSDLRVVVVGDLIIDEYITCNPLGMSQEDPTIVVLPINRDRFVGGAGCVAAHVAGLGAHVDYFGIVGADEVGEYATETMSSYGFSFHLLKDISRPTTLKQRFRANNKTLLRVSHLRQHSIDADLVETIYKQILAALDGAHVLVFSDFNYGCLPQGLVDELREHCIKRGIMMVADSQASSQASDVSRFQNMRLLTPTEHEARLAMHDVHSGLAVLAEALRQKANASHIVITLGAEGALIQTVDPITGVCMTDRLPAFNTSPKDITGAGDSLLACSALALAAGGDVWRSVYLGSLAAAFQVSRVGNHPLKASELISELV